jgi:hypothetical protein
VPHVYGYDAAMLLPGLWLAMFRADLLSTRIPALWLCTPFPFVFALAGRPWAAASSLSVLAMLAALAGEAHRLQGRQDVANDRGEDGGRAFAT